MRSSRFVHVGLLVTTLAVLGARGDATVSSVRYEVPRPGNRDRFSKDNTVWDLSISGDSRLLCLAVEGGPPLIWDLQDGRRLDIVDGGRSRVRMASMSPDGQRVAIVTRDKILKVLRRSDWGIEWSADVKTNDEFGGESARFSPEGKYLAVAVGALRSVAEDRQQVEVVVSVYDAVSGSRKHLWDTGMMGLLAFSSDGGLLALNKFPGEIEVHSLDDGRLVGSHKNHRYAPDDAVFSIDGRLVVSVSADSIWAWDMADGRAVGHWRNRELVRSLAMSADGRWLAGASPVGLLIWDMVRFRELLRLPVVPGGCASVLFSPDGKKLFAGARDRSVREWQMNDLIPLLESKAGNRQDDLAEARKGEATEVSDPVASKELVARVKELLAAEDARDWNRFEKLVLPSVVRSATGRRRLEELKSLFTNSPSDVVVMSRQARGIEAGRAENFAINKDWDRGIKEVALVTVEMNVKAQDEAVLLDVTDVWVNRKGEWYWYWRGPAD